MSGERVAGDVAQLQRHRGAQAEALARHHLGALRAHCAAPRPRPAQVPGTETALRQIQNLTFHQHQPKDVYCWIASPEYGVLDRYSPVRVGARSTRARSFGPQVVQHAVEVGLGFSVVELFFTFKISNIQTEQYSLWDQFRRYIFKICCPM